MNTRALNHHFLLSAFVVSVLALPVHAAAPSADSRNIAVNFNSGFNENEIVLGQGADLTFSVLLSPAYGEIQDKNGNAVVSVDIDSPVEIAKDGAGRAILKYKQSGVSDFAEPDIIVFEVKNSLGETSDGVIQLDVKLNTKIEIFTEDPEVNPSAIAVGVSHSEEEDQQVTLDMAKILDDSDSPTDLKTLWAKVSDDAGQVAYTHNDYFIDNTPPTLTWVEVPNDNTKVRGEVHFELLAEDNSGIKEVRLQAPSPATPLRDLESPWIFNYNSASVADTTLNPYSFEFEAVDLVDLVSAPKTSKLFVDNTPPAVTDISLVGGELLTSLEQITATVGDGTVSIFVDGAIVEHDFLPPHTYKLRNPLIAVGNHDITFRVTDLIGNVIDKIARITIQGLVDTPPQIIVDAPILDKPNISGTFTLDIKPTDDGQITTVEVSIDGGTPRRAVRKQNGYDYILDTTPLSDGNHTVTVIVKDNGGHTTNKDITINVNDTPVITTPTLLAGEDISGTHVIDIDPAAGAPALDRVEIYVDGEILTTLTGEPFEHPWNTTTPTLPDGPVDVVIVTRDSNGNESTFSQVVDINNVPDVPSGPVVETIGGNPDEHIGKGDITLSIIDTGITDVVFMVDGSPLTTTHVPPNHAQSVLHTTTLDDGPHTIYATYVKDGEQINTPIIDYRVDNKKPIATRIKPVLDEVVFGSVVIQAEVTDEGQNPIDHVDFYIGQVDPQHKIASPPGHPNPSDKLYDFVFDTTIYTNQLVNIYVVATDKAGNKNTAIVYRFTINNDLAMVPHPQKNAFVTSAADAKIYVELGGQLGIKPGYLSANAGKIFSVHIEKDGAPPVKLDGGAYSEGGKLYFDGEIPENAKVTWSVSIVGANDQLYEGLYGFTRAMAKSIGGTVISADGRFKLVVPADALPTDMLVTIVDEQTTQGIVNPALGNFESVNPGQNIVAGPFMVRGVDKNNATAQTIARAALCSYIVPAAEDDLNSPKVFQLAELFDNGKVFPLGSAGPRVSALDAEPTGTRTIDVPISRFGRFVITSQVMPEQGLSHFYNFPNPFNPNQGGTDFHYFLGADSSVKIMIYDLFGQEVRSFEIAQGSTGGKLGLNLFTWDGRNGAGIPLANGGYIARVLAEDSQGRRSKASYKVGVLK